MKTINDLIDNSATEYGTGIMLKDSERYVTYIGNNRIVRRRSNYLCKRYPKGTHMAVLGISCIEGVLAWESVVGSGNAVVLCADAERSVKDIADDLQRADVQVVLFHEGAKNVEDLMKALPDVEFLDFSKMEINEMAGQWMADVEENDTAEILFTSGSTGKAKMVMLSHRNVIQNVIGADACVKVRRGDVLTSVLPLYHSFEIVAGLLTPVFRGATICYDESLAKSRRNMTRNLRNDQPNILVAVPGILDFLLARARHAENPRDAFGENLRTIVLGGAPSNPAAMEECEKLGITCVEGFGITECSPIVACNRETAIAKGSVGKPLEGMEVRIKDDGEILVKGPCVMQGYYKDPSATTEAFENGWFKTGDIGRMDEEGNLYIVGRIKNLIILSNGENVSPEEIEEKILQIPGVKEAAVVERNHSLHAILHADSTAKEEILAGIEEMNKTMEPFKRINKRDVEFSSQPLPKTATGKIDRTAL